MKLKDAERIHDLYRKYLYRTELLRDAATSVKQFTTLSRDSAKSVKSIILDDYRTQLKEVENEIRDFCGTPS